MKKKEAVTRRKFLKKVSSHVGAGVMVTPLLASVYTENTIPVEKEKRLPREVWVGSVDIQVHNEKTSEERIKRILSRMEKVVAFQPDIICLPEAFPHLRIKEKKSLKEKAEEVPGPITRRIAEFAKKHNCYIVCPMYTKKDGSIYNSAVLIDRTGGIAGIYHKTYAVPGEIEAGITPGPIQPPVFKTDFGTIGIQICYDIKWTEGWRRLKEQGAEIVFFPSAAAGGRILGIRAYDNQYNVVSSTAVDARIIGITGEDIAASGTFSDWVCAPINLEKVFVNMWPWVRKLDELQKKYGRKIYIKLHQYDGLITVESLHPDVKVLEVLKEFNIPTYDEHIKKAEEVQNKHRL